MQYPGLQELGTLGRLPFVFPVMTGNHVQNTIVELLIPDPVLSQKIAGYLDSQYDMTQESAFVSVLDPGIEGYLSHLADIVEQRTGNQEVSVDAFTLFPTTRQIFITPRECSRSPPG